MKKFKCCGCGKVFDSLEHKEIKINTIRIDNKFAKSCMEAFGISPLISKITTYNHTVSIFNPPQFPDNIGSIGKTVDIFCGAVMRFEESSKDDDK